jgi:hypothetical protein
MRVSALESLNTDCDLQEELRQALADVEAAKLTHGQTLESLANAEGERQRVQGLVAQFSAAAAQQTRLYAESKRNFLATVTSGKAGVDVSDASLERAARSKRRTIDILSYATSFALPVAQADELRARIAERLAEADRIEAESVSMKLASVVASMSALSFDPGTTLAWRQQSADGVESTSMSEQMLKRVSEIRNGEVGALEKELSSLLTASTLEQSTLAGALFNN